MATSPQTGASRPDCWRQASRKRKGRASATRQKPDATGPTSASLTIHGPRASTRLPAISAGKAWRPAFAADDRDCCIVAFWPLRVRAPPLQGMPMPTLFDPIQLGATLCPNRIVMAPLTRGRATREHVPTELMVEYYRQRAGAGLIITEATGMSRQGLGWPYAPGIWTQEQMESWKPVVEAVHEAGGRIFCQLWHMGRVVHPSFLGGEPPVSASATTAPYKAHTYEG